MPQKAFPPGIPRHPHISLEIDCPLCAQHNHVMARPARAYVDPQLGLFQCILVLSMTTPPPHHLPVPAHVPLPQVCTRFKPCSAVCSTGRPTIRFSAVYSNAQQAARAPSFVSCRPPETLSQHHLPNTHDERLPSPCPAVKLTHILSLVATTTH